MKLLTIVLLLLSATLVAQEEIEFVKEKENYQTKNKLSLQLGAAKPLGSLSSYDFGSEESGYASGGVSFGLIYEYYFHPSVAITANYNSMRLAFNTGELERDFNNNNNNSLNFSVSSDNYIYNHYSIGIKTAFGNKVVRGYFNPVIGYSKLKFPEISIYISDSGQNAEIIYEETEDSQIMYGINIGSDIRVSDIISIGFNFGYFTSSSFLVETNIEENQNGRTYNSIELEYEISFSAISSTICLSFNF